MQPILQCWLTKWIVVSRQRIWRAHVSKIGCCRLDGHVALDNVHVLVFDEHTDGIDPARRSTHTRVTRPARGEIVNRYIAVFQHDDHRVVIDVLIVRRV